MPIPSPAEWTRLAGRNAHTTVGDVKVTQPLGWLNAVEAGRITDPGITAREITATVTLHEEGGDGGARTTTRSVALTANFEGPPTVSSWRFVTLVQYTAIQTGQTEQS